ncbi:MAG: fumarylacetoacetate hydrolase family protein [Alphaproteobacteria bacterium]|nr:fumarylacetoacetate hydrolase family protein [Alphaproteobacteria bacterium]
MKICRFNDDRLGLVRDDTIHDVTSVLEMLPPLRWPVPPGDQFIANLDRLRPEIEKRAVGGRVHAVGAVTLRSPVANPSKLIAAPLNYTLHVDESAKDAGIHHGVHLPGFEGFASPVDKFGLFLKAGSSLVGAGDGVTINFPNRRNDHEVELAVVIGRGGRNIAEAAARSHIAGYAIGLDMTVRGTEDRSFRKSADSYSVLGPWLVTADEIADPGNLDFWIRVGNERRQASNTRDLLVGIDRLIALASSCYTLYPGDVIFTGTPDGVNTVKPGDTMVAWIDRIGEMTVAVR